MCKENQTLSWHAAQAMGLAGQQGPFTTRLLKPQSMHVRCTQQAVYSKCAQHLHSLLWRNGQRGIGPDFFREKTDIN
jgi:hypothetical protein